MNPSNTAVSLAALAALGLAAALCLTAGCGSTVDVAQVMTSREKYVGKTVTVAAMLGPWLPTTETGRIVIYFETFPPTGAEFMLVAESRHEDTLYRFRMAGAMERPVAVTFKVLPRFEKNRYLLGEFKGIDWH